MMLDDRPDVLRFPEDGGPDPQHGQEHRNGRHSVHTSTEPEQPVSSTEHVHRFVVPPPPGRWVEARCSICGAVRQVSNLLDDVGYLRGSVLAPPHHTDEWWRPDRSQEDW